MKRTILFATLAAAIIINPLKAQETETAPAAAPETAPDTGTNSAKRWSIGLSGIVVDDDGESFNNLFNVGETWVFLPYPTRLNVDVTLDKHWSLEGSVAYSQMTSGKSLNGVIVDQDYMFLAADANARFHFMGHDGIFDPYGVAGLGFTYREALKEQTPTLNVGLGANIWFIEQFGLNLQTSGRVKLNQKSSNYMMHSVGIVYRFK